MTTDDRPLYRVTLRDDEIESLLAPESPAAPTQRDSILRVGIVDRLLCLVDELGIATVAYGEASEAAVLAKVAETAANESLGYAELDLRAKLLATGVPGTNEPTRKINLDLAVMDDADCFDLRAVWDLKREERVKADGVFDRCNQYQQSLRAQIGALQTLLNH